jgi:DNA modification methylase
MATNYRRIAPSKPITAEGLPAYRETDTNKPPVARGRVAITYRPISELKLDPNNPRTHSAGQIRQIAHSIETFSFVVPILVDSGLNVIAGHGRIMAAQQLGWHEVPTIRLEHLSDTQVKALKIADNRLGETSTWNDRLLAEQLKELSVLDLDFSIEVTGFAMAELDLRIQGLSESDAEDDPADKLPTITAKAAVSQPGDLWMLGIHRIHCGSALDAAAHTALMQGQKAAMVFTDPPYNVRIDGNVSGLGSISHREFLMASGEMSESEFTEFLTRTCLLLADNTVSGALHFICMDWRHMSELLAAGRQAYTEFKNLCIWAKDNAGMGSLYRSQHELIFVFKAGRDAHRNNIELGRFGRNRTNLWKYPGANTFARSSCEGNLLALHPTPKPIAMVADAIMDCSARNDIILDAFLGSGSTVIAAERTGRRCCGLELDPIYIDTIIRRWQAFTGGIARHAESGKSFNEIATERQEEDHAGRQE